MKKLFPARLNRVNFFLRNIVFYVSFYILLALNPTLRLSVPGYFYFLMIAGLIFATSLVIARLRDIGLSIWWFVFYFILALLIELLATQYILLVLLRFVNVAAMGFLFLYPGKRQQTSANNKT